MKFLLSDRTADGLALVPPKRNVNHLNDLYRRQRSVVIDDDFRKLGWPLRNIAGEEDSCIRNAMGGASISRVPVRCGRTSAPWCSIPRRNGFDDVTIIPPN